MLTGIDRDTVTGTSIIKHDTALGFPFIFWACVIRVEADSLVDPTWPPHLEDTPWYTEKRVSLLGVLFIICEQKQEINRNQSFNVKIHPSEYQQPIHINLVIHPSRFDFEPWTLPTCRPTRRSWPPKCYPNIGNNNLTDISEVYLRAGTWGIWIYWETLSDLGMSINFYIFHILKNTFRYKLDTSRYISVQFRVKP